MRSIGWVVFLMVLLSGVSRASATSFGPSALWKAPPSLMCHTVWRTPDSANSILECLKNHKRALREPMPLLPTALSLVLFLISVFAIPIIFFFFLCCECTAPFLPKTRLGSEIGRIGLLIWSIFTLLWSVLVIASFYYGFELLSTSIHGIQEDMVDGSYKYFSGIQEKVIDFTSEWSTGSRRSYPGLGVNVQVFDDLKGTFRHGLGRNYLSLLINLTFYLRFVGGVCVAVGFFVACMTFSRRHFQCSSFYLSFVCVLFAVIFTFLSVVFNTAAFLSAAGCGEVDLHVRRKPGVFQWKIVPQCQMENKLETLNNHVTRLESDLSVKTCLEIFSACDMANVSILRSRKKNGSSKKESKPSKCLAGTNYQAICANYDEMHEVLLATTIFKSGYCPYGMSTCSLEECADACENIHAKEKAAHILLLDMKARNASVARDFYKPLLDCDFMIDKLYKAPGLCENVKMAFFLLGFGFLVGSIMFTVSLYILIRGSCIWKEKIDEYEQSESECS